MRSLIIFVCLLALAACSDDAIDRAHLVDTPDAIESDGGADAELADVSTNVDALDDAGEPDAAEDACTCSTVDECCDGCEPINQGAACDDGLTCTLGTTCQSDGTCGAATGSPCDALLDSDVCQAATCDEVDGCSIRSVGQGFECDDGDPRTLDDRCDSGQCVGTPCECEEGACCDGCNFLPADTVCETGEERETCSAFETCGASRIRQEEQRRCSGEAGACEAPAEWVTVEVLQECGSDATCLSRNGSGQCWPSDDRCT